MSNLINFEGQQLDSIAQALTGFDNGSLSHSQQQQQQQQQQQHHQQQQQQQQHKQYHQRNDRYGQVPIDPSIGDSSPGSGKNEDSVTQELAQAAVQQSTSKQDPHSQQRSQSTTLQRNINDPNKVTKPRVNKPGQKFGAKKKSWVWNWFTQDPTDWNVATCILCSRPIKRLDSDKGSPKKLGEHLKTHKVNQLTPTDKRADSLIGGSEGITEEQLQQAQHGPQAIAQATGGTGSNTASGAESTRHYFNTINTTPETFKQHDSSTHPNSNSNSRNPDANKVGSSANQFAKQEFDQSDYTPAKFQKLLMKFLIDNKLPLSTVKSQSFKQIIYTLKPEVIADLNELNNLYSPLLDVINTDKNLNNDNVDVNDGVIEVDVGDQDVDEQLHNTGSGWV